VSVNKITTAYELSAQRHVATVEGSGFDTSSSAGLIMDGFTQNKISGTDTEIRYEITEIL